MLKRRTTPVAKRPILRFTPARIRRSTRSLSARTRRRHVEANGLSTPVPNIWLSPTDITEYRQPSVFLHREYCPVGFVVGGTKAYDDTQRTGLY
jgi:hypothetical protein